MAALIVLGIIVGLIVLLCLIPVGFDAGYEQGKVHVSAKVMGILLQLYPKPPPDPNKPPKEKKPKKEKPKKEQEEKKPKKRKLSFNRDELLELAKAALKALGRFGRKLQVDRFLLHLRLTGDDPSDTAILFGYLNAALSSLAPLARSCFTVKDSDVRTELDFSAEKTELDAALAMSIRIGQVLGVALGVGAKALVILLKNKRRLKREAKLNPPPPEETVTTDETGGEGSAEETVTAQLPEQTIREEERKESNGSGE